MKKKITTITVDDTGPGMNPFWYGFEKIGLRTITVQKDGFPAEIIINDAVMHKLVETALKGSPQSIRQYNELQRIAAEKKQHDINQDVVDWQEIKLRQHKKYVDHNKAHGCDPLDFPHPDDIIIDKRDGVGIIGPIDHDEYAAMRHTQRIVDACLWQDALDHRIAGWSLDDGPKSGALLIATLMNDSLPAREQINDAHMNLRMMRRHGMAKRQLLKETHQAWWDAGYAFKRGMRMRSIDEIKLLLTIVFGMLRIYRDPNLDEDAQTQAIDKLVYEQFG